MKVARNRLVRGGGGGLATLHTYARCAHMNEPNDDPYQIKDLSVQYDYLMFKIRDHILNLSEKTYKSVVAKKDAIDKDVFRQQADVDNELSDADDLIKQCDNLELLFMKLDQLYSFVEEFNKRVLLLELEFAQLSA